MGRHDQAPRMIAHRVNDLETFEEFLATSGFDGIEADIHDTGSWVVSHDRPKDGAIELSEFLDEVVRRRDVEEHDPALPVMLEIKSKAPGVEPYERLLETVRAHEGAIEPIFVSFDMNGMHDLREFLIANDWDRPCQVFISGDGSGQVKWRANDLENLTPLVGVHLRLHTFPRTKVPTFEEVHMMRRHITTSGWNPLMPGWRRLDLSHVWNIRDM